MVKNVKFKKRFCFNQDKNHHWYLIPLVKRELFDAVLYDEQDPDGIKFDSMFQRYALLGNISCYSFVDPAEDF